MSRRKHCRVEIGILRQRGTAEVILRLRDVVVRLRDAVVGLGGVKVIGIE